MHYSPCTNFQKYKCVSQQQWVENCPKCTCLSSVAETNSSNTLACWTKKFQRYMRHMNLILYDINYVWQYTYIWMLVGWKTTTLFASSILNWYRTAVRNTSSSSHWHHAPLLRGLNTCVTKRLVFDSVVMQSQPHVKPGWLNAFEDRLKSFLWES